MKESTKTIFLVSLFVIIGILLLFFGIKITYDKAQITKNYVSVEGKFVESSIYSSDSDGTTYTLTYSYIVDGAEYTVSTDYGSGSVPKKGTIKTIRYNPNNPSEAVISGFDFNELLLVLGLMFMIIPLVLAFFKFSNLNNLIKFKLQSTLLGCFFVIVGAGYYYIMCSSGDSLSIISAFKTNGFEVFIPVMFVIMGIGMTISSLLHKNKAYNYGEHIPVEYILEEDDNVYIKNEAGDNDKNSVIEKIDVIFSPILQIIVSLILTSLLGWLFVKGIDIVAKIIITPFLLCGIISLLKSIISLVQNLVNYSKSDNYGSEEKKEKIKYILTKSQSVMSHLYMIIFLTFWFGILIVSDYQAIKTINDGGFIMLLYSLIFWAVGIFMVYKLFKK